MEIGKTDKHCTNYGKENHNVETCKVKKKGAYCSSNKNYQSTLEGSKE
jgi:hypothetical protein